jgi:Rrf2 family protein
MLSLSTTTGYAIKALRCLESGVCRPRIADIADAAGIPRPYLAKIIQSLSKSGLVFTKRGYTGGIRLVRRPEFISLLDIVIAVEGEHWMSDCLLALEDCRGPSECPTLPFWNRIRGEIEQELRRWTLSDLIKSSRGVGEASCCDDGCGSTGTGVS